MPDVEATRKRLESLAWLLDSAIAIPGTNFRIGVDALIGLIPGFGDIAGVLLSSYIVREAAALGVPKSVLVRMSINIAVEGLIGIVPLAGDLFDAAWKANQRNVRLLNEYLERPHKVRRSSRVFVFALLTAVLVLIVTAGIGGFLLLRWIFGSI